MDHGISFVRTVSQERQSYAAVTKAPNPSGLLQQKFIIHSCSVPQMGQLRFCSVSSSQADRAASIRNTARLGARGGGGGMLLALKCLAGRETHHSSFKLASASHVAQCTPGGWRGSVGASCASDHPPTQPPLSVSLLYYSSF